MGQTSTHLPHLMQFPSFLGRLLFISMQFTAFVTGKFSSFMSFPIMGPPRIISLISLLNSPQHFRISLTGVPILTMKLPGFETAPVTEITFSISGWPFKTASQAALHVPTSVSYTHLDVYKRQLRSYARFSSKTRNERTNIRNSKTMQRRTYTNNTKGRDVYKRQM